MIACNSEISNEILDFIRWKLELPENLLELHIRMQRDSIIFIECSYYPKVRDHENKD